MKTKKRCKWSQSESKLMIAYHDKEWGVPVHSDQKLFEMLVLEGMQAGLSWSTILNKRENYRKAFHNFNPAKIVKMTQRDVEKQMKNAGIIRNRLKINAIIKNAHAFFEIKKEFGTFYNYIWKFTNHKPIKNKFKSLKQIPATTNISDVMSKDLKKRGFTFVGSTICYAFMQAIGMVNDHEISCFRYKEV